MIWDPQEITHQQFSFEKAHFRVTPSLLREGMKGRGNESVSLCHAATSRNVSKEVINNA